MTHAAASPRFVGAFGALALSISVLAACAPTPEPTPTPTALFASDEEAFAAAEETYRAYLAAANATDLAEPATFESVFDWLTGTALSAERESLSLYHAEGLSRVGTTTFDTFEPVAFQDGAVVVNLCIDVADVDLQNGEGESVIPPDRAPRSGRKVTFVPGDTSTALLIASNHKPDEGFSC